MSEIKKLAKELQDYTRVVGSHNKHIQSVVNRLVELTEQPQLNENQRQVLGWLKTGYCDGDSVFEALEQITYVYEDPKTEEALESLSTDQEVQVINSFMKWALEQEEG